MTTPEITDAQAEAFYRLAPETRAALRNRHGMTEALRRAPELLPGQGARAPEAAPPAEPPPAEPASAPEPRQPIRGGFAPMPRSRRSMTPLEVMRLPPDERRDVLAQMKRGELELK